MSKTSIGIMFILAGMAYAGLAIDGFYAKTLGALYKNGFLKTPPPEQLPKSLFGPKGQIFIYSSILIIIGIYILWNRNI